MKALIFSDTHGNISNMQCAINHFEEIDTIIHLGDYLKDIHEIEKKFSNKNIYYISGNHDYTGSTEKILEFAGRKIFITHGHKYAVYYGCEKLYYRAKELRADIVLYGHTHKPVAIEGDILILNPGSITEPRGIKLCTFAIIDFNEEISYKFYAVNDENVQEIKIKDEKMKINKNEKQN